MGTGSDKIFQVKKNLMKAKGDTVDFTLRGILTGNGQSDDGTYEGNEESISLFSVSATIHERGNAVKVNGEMSEQRTIVNLRDESKSALGEWNGRVQALDMICALSGLPTLSLAVGVRSTTLAQDASSHNIETVNPVALTKSATATRYFAGGQTVAGVFERGLLMLQLSTQQVVTSLAHWLSVRSREWQQRPSIQQEQLFVLFVL